MVLLSKVIDFNIVTTVISIFVAIVLIALVPFVVIGLIMLMCAAISIGVSFIIYILYLCYRYCTLVWYGYGFIESVKRIFYYVYTNDPIYISIKSNPKLHHTD